MRKYLATVASLLLTFPTGAIAAGDISGTWQGKGATQYVLNVTPAPDGTFRGDFYSVEERGLQHNGNPISSIAVTGDIITFGFDRSLVTFKGTLSTDGNSITGTLQSFSAEKLIFEKATSETAWVIDASPHMVHFIPTDKGVTLEVLDWGGEGPPLVFLAGGGFTAHVFDTFAPKFAQHHHVYAITRRGFGVSSWPAPTQENYDPDRLADDVLAVIDALKLDKPVLAGHSISGEELSSIGTHHPEKISGLIYLDAGYAYAYYDPNGDKSVFVYAAAIERDVRQLIGAGTEDTQKLIADIRAMLPKLEQGLEPQDDLARHLPQRKTDSSASTLVNQAMISSARKYEAVKSPVLAIFAEPKECKPYCGLDGIKTMYAQFTAQIDAFQKGNPAARVVRLPYANHLVFQSNEAEVMAEMNRFMDSLSGP